MLQLFRNLFSPGQAARVILVCLIGTLILFIPGLGAVHLFDWDEINFAECAREMIILDDYLQVSINYQPFWEKPPFFIWLQVIFMKLVGINEFAARLPNVVCAFISMLMLYFIGRSIHSHRFGIIWIITYLGSLLPHFYFRSGIIDPWFNLFIFSTYFYIYKSYICLRKNKSFKEQLIWMAAAGLACGLACLTKGPVGWLIPTLSLAVLFILYRFSLFISPVGVVLFSLLSFSGLGIWFWLDYQHRGPWLMTEFLSYQYRLFSTPDAGHEGFPGFHFVVLLLGCFPASIFALRAFRLVRPTAIQYLEFQRWMIVLCFVVLILFSIVQSKIIHYTSLAYFPLTFLATTALFYSSPILMRWQRTLLWGLAGLYTVVFIAVPVAARFRSNWIDLIADPFAYANLEVPVHWSGFEGLPILLLLIGVYLTCSRFKDSDFRLRIMPVFVGTGLALALLFYTIMPKIEPHTQGEAIRFYKYLQGQDVYVHTLGYKSYAHYFYARPPVPTHPEYFGSDPQAWLLQGAIDKPVYFSCRIDRLTQFDSPEYEKSGLKRLYESGGFAFFRREPPDASK